MLGSLRMRCWSRAGLTDVPPFKSGILHDTSCHLVHWRLESKKAGLAARSLSGVLRYV